MHTTHHESACTENNVDFSVEILPPRHNELTPLQRAIKPGAGNWFLPALMEIPEGHLAHRMTSDMHRPHLRFGQHAVVDLDDREIVPGELYLFDGMFTQDPMQVMYREEGVWICPMLRPKTLEQVQVWMDRGMPLYSADGPFRHGYIDRYARGRVVGVYREQ